MLLGRIISSAIILAALTCAPPAASASIYDARIEQRLPMKPEQRVKVRRVIAESRRQFLAAFNKHGIDPNATPEFGQLFRASADLMAISRRERQEMSRILTHDQLVLYDGLMRETQARVRAAAQRRSGAPDAHRSTSRQRGRRAVVSR